MDTIVKLINFIPPTIATLGFFLLFWMQGGIIQDFILEITKNAHKSKIMRFLALGARIITGFVPGISSVFFFFDININTDIHTLLAGLGLSSTLTDVLANLLQGIAIFTFITFLILMLPSALQPRFNRSKAWSKKLGEDLPKKLY